MSNVIVGTSKNDLLNGTSNEDVIYGLSGDDTVNGGNGNDVISGGTSASAASADNLVMDVAFKGQVTVEAPRNGSVNPVGMYKIDKSGNIVDVRLLWTGDTSGSKGSGNAPTIKTTDVSLLAGERYGFFILSNGYGTNGNTKLFSDSSAQWQLRNGKGEAGKIGDTDLRLWHVNSKTGTATAITNSSGHEIYHSIGSEGSGFSPNPDGKSHASTTIDYAQGIVTIGLESSRGNNPDFKDAIIRFNIGIDNALELGEPDPAGNGGDDVLNGGEGDDRLLGMAGDDVLAGGNGQDRLWGNSGHDRLAGDGGDDWLSGGNGNDTIYGGQGQDKLFGRTGQDFLFGDDGDDQMWGDDGDDQLAGGNNNDWLYGGKGNDRLSGDVGDDRLQGDTGDDTISGGDNNDQIKGGDGNDIIGGDNGDDLISGGKGADQITGDAGHDNIKGDTGHDVISGGDGDDRLFGGDGNDSVDGGNGHDQISAGKGDDVIRGGFGDDRIKGDSGNDVIIAGGGNDVLEGGSGHDTIDLSEIQGAIKIDLGASTLTGAGNTKIQGFESVIGTTWSDTILGNKADNTLIGGSGNDTLTGARGSDVLSGGEGDDRLLWISRKDVTGELGLDDFVDTIKDLSANDILDLSGFKLDASSGIESAVKAVVTGSDVELYAKFGTMGFVLFAVIEDAGSYDVAAKYSDGLLLI